MKQFKNRIYQNITRDEILKMREFNKATFHKKHLSKQEMSEYLEMLYDIILHSNYICQIRDSFEKNVTDTWIESSDEGFEKVKMSDEVVKNILKKEIESLENCSEESLALKVGYWVNRMVHNVEKDTIRGRKKYEMNHIYTKYFLNPKYKYGLEDLLDYREGNASEDFANWIDDILHQERSAFENSNSKDRVVNLFLGFYLKNELFTTKAQMLKELIHFHSEAEKPNVLLTFVPEVKDDISIKREPTVRLIAREKNAIAPVVMHTDASTFEKIQVPEEQNPEVAKFAQRGRIGMHFILSKEELAALESLVGTNEKLKQLSDIMLRGEEDNVER